MNEIFENDKLLTIPNVLSIVRVLLVPLFSYFYFVDCENHFLYAGIVLLVSGGTDVLDGIIARKFNMISSAGKILDPLADKLTQAFVIVCLTINHFTDSTLVYVLILFFAKELTMVLGAVILLKMGKRPSESKWWGKLGTVMVYLLFMAVLIQDIFTPEIISEGIINVVAVMTAICLVFSLFNYYPIFKEIQTGEYKLDEESSSKDN